uniref:Uncharacterized protein n=1 Tax=Physcomitrium patens TaxID=3218 RepID=A0A2K1KXI2_PHYPA|nr:hypothetical protein PHYPA_005492 [Physcomitrium patens]
MVSGFARLDMKGLGSHVSLVGRRLIAYGFAVTELGLKITFGLCMDVPFRPSAIV